MSESVLERISANQFKLVIVLLIFIQFLSFLIGQLIAPAPSSAMSVLGTKCIDKNYSQDNWYWVRGKDKCQSIRDYDAPVIAEQHLTADNIIYAFQVPTPRDGEILHYSRWQQNLIAMINFDMMYNDEVQFEPRSITIDARLGYQDRGDTKEDKWTEYAVSTEWIPLDCSIDPDKRKNGYMYNCSHVPLFELGSLHHDYYLLNVRLPVSEYYKLSFIADLWVTFTHQNGGFTKVWVSLKTIFFPTILAMMIWFWHRVSQLSRTPVLLEYMIMMLGVALTILNCPLEYLTLHFDCPWMTVVNNIRKDLFYASLLFFAGQHIVDNTEGIQTKVNWCHFGIILASFLCFLVCALIKGGFQLCNVFHPIWAIEYLKNVLQGFTIVAALCAIGYLLLLVCITWKVFRNISSMQDSLPVDTFKLKFLLLASLYSAALTVIGFIVELLCEVQWMGSVGLRFEYISFLLTGVYGTWNVYTFFLLFLYAPSSKRDFHILGGDQFSGQLPE